MTYPIDYTIGLGFETLSLDPSRHDVKERESEHKVKIAWASNPDAISEAVYQSTRTRIPRVICPLIAEYCGYSAEAHELIKMLLKTIVFAPSLQPRIERSMTIEV